jgi:hypothetical protein
VAELSIVGTYAQPSPSVPNAIPGVRGVHTSSRFDHPPLGACPEGTGGSAR